MVVAFCPVVWGERMKSGPLWAQLERSSYPLLWWFCSAILHSLTWQYVLAWLLLGLHEDYYYVRLCTTSIMASAMLLVVPTLSQCPDALLHLFFVTFPGFAPVSTTDDDDDTIIPSSIAASSTP